MKKFILLAHRRIPLRKLIQMNALQVAHGYFDAWNHPYTEEIIASFAEEESTIPPAWVRPGPSKT
jgi:hypothetical protein